MRKAKHVHVQMFPLEDVLPNPYRKINEWALDEDKIERLMQSYENTGFWDGSIQGRFTSVPGKVEIAYGHHRIEAARRKNLDQVGIVVTDRSNEQMIQMMANENAAEFKHDAWVTVETISVVIEAFGRGEIALKELSGHGANQQQYSLPCGKHYSLAAIARFLGWIKPSNGQATSACAKAFDAYRERAVTSDAVKALTPEERSEVSITTVTTAVKAARVEAERVGLSPSKIRQSESRAAEQAVKEIQDTSGFKARDKAVALGKQAVKDITGAKKKESPPIEMYIAALIDKCVKRNAYGDILTEFYRLVPFIDDINGPLAHKLAEALDEMLKRPVASIDSAVRALRSGNYKQILIGIAEKKGM